MNLFENLQIFNESENKIISEFKEFLASKNAQYIANEIGETKDGMQIVIYDGDWKHEHLYMKHLLDEFFTNKGIDIRIVSEEIGESEQDNYSARYDIEFNPEPKKYTIDIVTEDVDTSNWKQRFKGMGVYISDKYPDYQIKKSYTSSKQEVWQVLNFKTQREVFASGTFEGAVKWVEDKDVSKAEALDNIEEGKHYGGAYDISDTAYFTRDDLDEFSNEVIEQLSNATHGDIIANVVDCYLDEDTNELELTVSYGEYEHTHKEKIDMRKIKVPKDLIKAYSNKFVNDFFWCFNADTEHEEMIKESNTDIDTLIDKIGGISKVKEILADIKDAYPNIENNIDELIDMSYSHVEDDLSFREWSNVVEYINESTLLKESNDKSKEDVERKLISLVQNKLSGPLADRVGSSGFYTQGEEHFMAIPISTHSDLFDFNSYKKELKQVFPKSDIFCMMDDYELVIDVTDFYQELTESNNVNYDDNSSTFLNTLEKEVKEAAHKFMLSVGFPEDEADDYLSVSTDINDDYVMVAVGAELEYDSLFNLCKILDKVIAKHDKDAYFEPECPGRIVAYLFGEKAKNALKEKEQTLKNKINSLTESDEVDIQSIRWPDYLDTDIIRNNKDVSDEISNIINKRSTEFSSQIVKQYVIDAINEYIETHTLGFNDENYRDSLYSQDDEKRFIEMGKQVLKIVQDMPIKNSLTETNHNMIEDRDYATGEKIYNAFVEYLNSLDQIAMDGDDCNWEPSEFNAKNLNADGEIYLECGAYVLIYPYVNEWAEEYFKVVVVDAETCELSIQIKNSIERIFNKFKTNKWKLVFEG